MDVETVRREPIPVWSPLRLGVVLAVAGAALFGLSEFSVELAPRGSNVAAWWPAAGVSVALVTLLPRSAWPWAVMTVILSSGLANYAGGRPVGVSAGFAIANAAEALLVAALLTGAGRRRPRLATMEDLGRFLVAVAAGAVTIGLLAGVVVRVGAGGEILRTAASVIPSHGASNLLIVPLVLFLLSPVRGRTPWVEVAAQAAILAVGVHLVFTAGQIHPLAFLPFPVLIWAALRFRPEVVAVEALAVALLVSLRTAQGSGMFAEQVQASDADVAALVQVYLVVLALVYLPLAVATLQRRGALTEAVAGRESYHRVLTDSVVGMLLLRPSTRGAEVLEGNQPAADLLACDLDALRGNVWTHGLTATQASELSAECHVVASGGEHSEREMLLVSDRARWVRVSLSPLQGPRGENLVSVQLVDLTELRESQTALEGERDFTAAVLDSADALILVLDEGGHILRHNQAVEAVSGRSAPQLLRRSLWDAMSVDPGRRPSETDLRDGAPSAGRLTGEHDWVTVQGERRTIAWACAPMGADGQGLRVYSGIDVTEAQQAQRLLEKLLEASTGTSIIGSDPDGTITFFNPGAERMLGYRGEGLIGKFSPALFHDDGEIAARAAELGVPEGFEVFVRVPRRTGQPERRDWTYVKADGQRLTVSLTVSAMYSGTGRVTGYLGVAEDVTERRTVERALEVALAREKRAVENLEELDRIKSDFVSSVSHELRTPMTSVLGYTQLLETGVAGPLNDEQRGLLERVERNGHRLLRLIEDLLSLARIEAGTWEIQDTEPVDMATVLGYAVEGTEGVRAGRRLQLTVGVQPDIESMVKGDAVKLEQVVVNLISNAVKFTPDGGRIELELCGGGGEVVLTVRDSGVGIAQEDQGRLFERFYRTARARQGGIPGTGLGLSIVQSIVQAHHGRIELTSEEGAGTTVLVHLPVGAPCLRQ